MASCGLLVVNWDHQGESFVVALDKGSGDERWRAVRDETTGRRCWRSASITPGGMTCVEPATGATLFGPARLLGAGSIFASPVAAAGRISIVSREGREVP